MKRRWISLAAVLIAVCMMVPALAGLRTAAEEETAGAAAQEVSEETPAAEAEEPAETEAPAAEEPAETELPADEEYELVFSKWEDEAPALNALIDYVESVTDEASPDYIPPVDRIAVFDMDGTLMGELYPTYLEYYMLAWRILKDPSITPDKEMLEVGRALRDHALDNSFPSDMPMQHALQAARAYAGMTLPEFADFVTEILLRDVDGFEGMTYGECFYLPMVEVVEYLQENGFKCYVCSGSDRFICRTFIEGMLDIPNENVIGMDVRLEATGQGDTAGLDYVFTTMDDVVRTDELLIKNLKTNKVLQIAQEIGRQPVLSFGNSSGDVSMHNYTISNRTYKSMAFMLIADDEVRDYGNAEKAAGLRERWEKAGYNVISMANDWKTIYGENVVKTGTFRWLEELADDRHVIDYMALINKQNALPEGWEEALQTVTTTNSLGDEVEVEKKAYDAYLKLKADLEKDGVYVDLDSARRSVAEQQRIVEDFTERYGAEYTAATVATPGFSEHHTGLALDLYFRIKGNGDHFKDIYYNEDMVEYPEIWEKIHAKLADYGFILRYLEGKEEITGYSYEPWHIRYIDDVDLAKEITEKGITLEEYLGAVPAPEADPENGAAEDETGNAPEGELPDSETGKAAEAELPESHPIPYDPALDTLEDEDGADAYDHYLDHADSRYYKVNDFYNMTSGDGLHILTNFETYQQTTEYSCGCASALMVLNHYGVSDYNEMDICRLAETDTSMGTSVEGLVKFFTELGWDVTHHADTEGYFQSIEECENFFVEKLDQGTPVMVDWVDWAGHWQVVIGLDTCATEDPYDDVLIVADPYDITDHFQDGYYTIPFGRFIDMWREGPCAQKAEPYVQPFVVAVPK